MSNIDTMQVGKEVTEKVLNNLITNQFLNIDTKNLDKYVFTVSTHPIIANSLFELKKQVINEVAQKNAYELARALDEETFNKFMGILGINITTKSI